jgi:hypothetical protein
LALSDDDGDDEPDHQGEAGDAEKAGAPADGGGRERKRRGRQQRADGAEADLQAGQRRKAIGSKPPRINGERGNQRAGGAEAEQAAAENQHAGAGRRREHERAHHGDGGAHHQAQPRTEAVERHADRDLHRGEGEEERARKEPDLGRGKAQLTRQVGRDDADRIAQKLADDVDRDQRGDERDGGARERGARGGLDAHEPGVSGVSHQRSVVSNQVPSRWQSRAWTAGSSSGY